MSWQLNPYMIPMLAVAACAAAMAVVAWRRRPSPGAEWLTLLMGSVAWYAVFYSLELSSADLPSILTWVNLEYIGIVLIAPAWVVFLLSYSSSERWLRKRFLLLFLLPAVNLLMVWTNSWHGLFYTQTGWIQRGGLIFFQPTYGPWFWVHGTYNLLLVLMGLSLTLIAFFRSSSLYRRQAAMMLFGAVVPALVQFSYMLKFNPFPGLDLLPFSFLPTGLAAILAFSRLRLLELAPIAQAAVLEGMDDLVLVLNNQSCCVDLNGAAQRWLGKTARQAMGRPIAELLADQPELIHRFVGQSKVNEEMEVLRGGEARQVEVRISPLRDRRGTVLGRLVVARDITDRKKVERAIARQDRLLEGVSRAVNTLFTESSLEDAVQRVLRTLGENTEVDRVYVFENVEGRGGEHRMSLRFDWARAGTEPLHGNPRFDELSYDAHFPRWYWELSEERLIRGLVRDFPESERDILVPQGVVSMLAVSVHVKDRFWGFIGFDDCHQERQWEGSDISILSTAAGSVGGAIAQRRAEATLHDNYIQLRGAMEGTVKALTSLLGLKDPYTASHQKRVTELAMAIGDLLGLEEGRLDGLRVAGSLHDIGKLTIPAEILSKPARLNPMEREMVQGHCRASYEILKEVDFPWPVAEFVFDHHERMDGSGYPRGLKGEEIPLESRILMVADVMEAISSHRPYRPALGEKAGLEEIDAGKGRLYDPQVAEACLRAFQEGFVFSA